MPNNDNSVKLSADPGLEPDDYLSDGTEVRFAKLQQGIELLRSALSRLKGTESDPASLLKELEPFRETIVPQLCRGYHDRYVGNALPLSVEAALLADALIDLHRAMARTYRCIFEKVVAGGLAEDAKLAPALSAAFGAQHHLKQGLLIAYESYRAEPVGIWGQIHGIHQLACAHDIDRIPVNGGRRTTLTKTYKHALLLGLSNPYHLPPRIISKIDALLPSWLERAKLSARLPSRNDRCVFLVDAALDRPAIPLLSNSAIPRFGDHLYLETSYLAQDLRQQMREVDNKETPGGGGDRLALQMEELKTLRPLIKRWRSHQIRSTTRETQTTDCQLAIGTNSVTRAISDPVMLSRIEDPVEIVLSGESVNGRGPSSSERYNNVLHISSDCQIRDSSPRGFRLAFGSAQGAKIRVNELVAVKPRDGKQRWLTGLVRWAKVSADKNLEIGVRRLAHDARPVSISSYATWGESRDIYVLALLLPGDNGSEGSLIIPKSDFFDPELAVVKCLDRGEWSIRLGKAISIEPSFYWYQVDSRAPSDDMTWSEQLLSEALVSEAV